MSWRHFRPYVPVAERQKRALKKIKAMEGKGEAIEPLGPLADPKKIAASFWGRAWCAHLESFSDYENRLPRGRAYVRNGSVLHLAIQPGVVEALVQGSKLYKTTIRIDPLPPKKWAALQARCQGGIGSLIELLQGRISGETMAVVTDRDNGLFPKPDEIHMDCSCPDWATMCKHVAAVLYGVGARLDHAPELLFKLRNVDHERLVGADASAAALAGARRGKGGRRVLDAGIVSEVFGADLGGGDAPPESLHAPARPGRPAKAWPRGARKAKGAKPAAKKSRARPAPAKRPLPGP